MENIPQSQMKRVVIIGGGFAGLKLALNLDRRYFQVVLLDKNNYHQFQPLMYQVATAGLEPSSISFPFRKALQDEFNTHIRITEVTEIDAANKVVKSTIGDITYDYLVLAAGADTNYFGMANIAQHALPMKSVAEALAIRNILIERLEKAVTTKDPLERKALLTIAIVGGGPTGVELSGAIAEMKRFVLPKDYPEINFDEMKVHLFESSARVLEVMSEKSSRKAGKYLTQMGVTLELGRRVTDFDGNQITISDGEIMPCKTLVWAAGIKANRFAGLREDIYGRGGRMLVNRQNLLQGYEDIYVLGDGALMTEPKFPNGHPQLAPVAASQALLLAENLVHRLNDEPEEEYSYFDKGSMATVGRNKAVVDLPFLHFGGFFAWLTWLFVHILLILGVKNKIFVFINWMQKYFTYNDSLRLLIKPKTK